MMMVVPIVRYRYRLNPTPGQQQMLARTFGCCRVVYNDAIRCRDEAYKAGEKLSASQVQTRVITEAKQAKVREWLGEVASVALVQSVGDAHKAHQNWQNSLSGKRKGPKAGRPRRKSRKDHRQSFRLTRNGFSLRDGGVYLARIGVVDVVWSRELPAPASSVSVIKEPDGRYYASFVVERVDTALPTTDRECGVDMGLDMFASIAYSDGTDEKVSNPRYLRAAERRLARAQRALSRKAKGSKNRQKARHRMAVEHRKVREKRADAQNKLAHRLARDNQAVYVETLGIKGLARTRLAKSVNDAAWGQFLGKVKNKADQYGRLFHPLPRQFPSSQICSACGHRDGPKPLKIREWDCPHCGTHHDRDLNAARNLLFEGQRQVAAGRKGVAEMPRQAETGNARGAGVSQGGSSAVGVEAGTHRGDRA